jgi:hypothetical protein
MRLLFAANPCARSGRSIARRLWGRGGSVNGEDCRTSAPYSIAYRSRMSQTRSIKLYCGLWIAGTATVEFPPTAVSSRLHFITPPSCSLQDNVQQLTASLMDQLVIQAVSSIRPQPELCHTSH